MVEAAQKTTEFVETNTHLRALRYEKPLRFTYDSALKGTGGFKYIYEEGEIRCSVPGFYAELCRMAPGDLNSISNENMGFIYLDAGRWGGGGTADCRRYSFGIVCGKDVYLCEYLPGTGLAPRSQNALVNDLLTQLNSFGCTIRVLSYANVPAINQQTASDSPIFILIPDYHLAPISWYVNESGARAAMSRLMFADPPDWFRATAAFKRKAEQWGGYRYLHGARLASLDFYRGESRSWPPHHADIFADGGNELTKFLTALTRLTAHTKSRTVVVQLGDMFELWLGREYQFKPGAELKPKFVSGGEQLAADWAAEVMLWNTDVIEAHMALDKAGFAAVHYLWGNHDAYLMDAIVTSQLNLPARSPCLNFLGGALHIEHGHRFDSSNYDNIKNSDGPFWANRAFDHPALRQYEKQGRGELSRVSGHPYERDCYFLGASLLYLNLRLRQNVRPFSIFCMGHTHSPCLSTFRIGYGTSELYGGSSRGYLGNDSHGQRPD